MNLNLKPIIPMEDFSHLNPPSSARSRDAARSAWNKLPSAEKERRAKLQSAAGKRNKGKVRNKFE